MGSLPKRKRDSRPIRDKGVAPDAAWAADLGEVPLDGNPRVPIWRPSYNPLLPGTPMLNEPLMLGNGGAIASA
jgi:hypothetical protein